MKKWLITGLIFIVVIGLWTNLNQTDRDFDSEIQSIVSVPQTYDGDYVDKLAALGSEAVPYLGQALLDAKKFPYKYVKALRNIGDESATEYLVEFINRRKPWSSAEEDTLAAEAIIALISVNGKKSISTMISIYTNADARLRVRLAAAAVVAALSDDEKKLAAQKFLTELYEKREEYLADPNTGFAVSELERAMKYVKN